MSAAGVGTGDVDCVASGCTLRGGWIACDEEEVAGTGRSVLPCVLSPLGISMIIGGEQLLAEEMKVLTSAVCNSGSPVGVDIRHYASRWMANRCRTLVRG